MAEADSTAPLLIKRYASRRLYNTETSDYVTLDDVAGLIRAGRQVQIIDLKTGDDLTRQYLLQIIAEHESRGENVLPIEVLTDLVRSYTTQAQSVVPQFLAASYEMLREGQSKLMENLTTFPNPMASMPGFEALQRQQQAFLRALAAGWGGGDGETEARKPGSETAGRKSTDPADMDEIRRQLAELQKRISRL